VTSDHESNYLVAVIGAGPAGLYAANHLAENGAHVVLFNRDIKPGGLAEYGIFHKKHRMKEGLRKQFRSILASDTITYYGNVTIGTEADLSLDELKQLGFQAILVSVGAQGTKWLGLPGEDLDGVYHAKDIVYHYNKLPPYSEQTFSIGKRVALIGVGNVMIDIAHWAIRDLKVEEVIAVARRGPAEIKFTKKELQNVARNLDMEALDAEFERVSERMHAVGQVPEEAKAFIQSAFPKALEPVSDTRFRIEFLSSPKQMLGDENGHVCGLEVDDTKLEPRNGDTKAVRMGTTRILDVDTVVFCIGDKVDENFGLPIQWSEFVKNPEPCYSVNDLSYEAYDPEAGAPIEGIFVAGWSREASSGLVGIARKDGECGAKAILQYLDEVPPAQDIAGTLEKVCQVIGGLSHPVVDKMGVQKLEALENAEAEKQGLDEFKFGSNEEMLSLCSEGK
jgi:ferredoxin--NADP+ reductase